MIRVNGRVLEIGPSRSATGGRLESSATWWESLAILGASLVLLGSLVNSALGSAAGIGGVVGFLAAAALAGAERFELATALGVSGVVWTSAGIAVYLGVDRFLWGSFLGFVAVGGFALILGGAKSFQRRAQRHSETHFPS
jgi:hypothetical protein